MLKFQTTPLLAICTFCDKKEIPIIIPPSKKVKNKKTMFSNKKLFGLVGQYAIEIIVDEINNFNNINIGPFNEINGRMIDIELAKSADITNLVREILILHTILVASINIKSIKKLSRKTHSI